MVFGHNFFNDFVCGWFLKKIYKKCYSCYFNRFQFVKFRNKMLRVKAEKNLKAGICVDTNFMLNCWAFSLSMMRRRPLPFLYAHNLSLPFSPSLVVAFDAVVTQDCFLLHIHLVFASTSGLCYKQRERDCFWCSFRECIWERVKNEGHETDRQNCFWISLSLLLSFSVCIFVPET